MNEIRTRQFLKLVAEDPTMPLGQVLVKVGLSPGYAAQVTRILSKKSFRENFDSIIEDEGILSVLYALLNKREHHVERYDINTPDEKILLYAERMQGFYAEIEVKTETKQRWVGSGKSKKLESYEEEYKELSYFLADVAGADKALDKIFKIRSDYSPEEHNLNLLTPFIKSIQKGNNEKNKIQITGGE